MLTLAESGLWESALVSGVVSAVITAGIAFRMQNKLFQDNRVQDGYKELSDAYAALTCHCLDYLTANRLALVAADTSQNDPSANETFYRHTEEMHLQQCLIRKSELRLISLEQNEKRLHRIKGLVTRTEQYGRDQAKKRDAYHEWIKVHDQYAEWLRHITGELQREEAAELGQM